MKRMEKLKYLSTGIAIGLAMTNMIVPVIAKSTQANITAIYKNIKIVVDGKAVDTADSEPFIYNGTTYLPVRAVANALGKSVYWDADTNSIYIGGSPEGQYMSDILEPYYSNGFYTINHSMTMSGIGYTKGYTLYTGLLGSTFSFNLNKEYTSISGLLGLDDSCNDDSVTLQVFCDNVMVKAYTLEEGSLPIDITIDVSNVEKLDFVARSDSGLLHLDLCNAIIK